MTSPKTPRKRAPKTEPEAVDGALCGLCWPSGWPEDAAGAACIHGQWSRS